jgi:hypothetical protein
MEQLAVHLAVPREDSEEDHAVRLDLDHLGDAGIGVMVAHEGTSAQSTATGRSW